MYVFVNTGGCRCVGVVYVSTHTHIYILIWSDLGGVVCCSACDEVRTHIHENRFMLVEN